MTTWIICGVIGLSLVVFCAALARMASGMRAFRDAARTLTLRLRPAADLLPAVVELQAHAERLQPRIEAAAARASTLQAPGKRHPAS